MQFANQQNMGKNTKQKHKSTKRDFSKKVMCNKINGMSQIKKQKGTI